MMCSRLGWDFAAAVVLSLTLGTISPSSASDDWWSATLSEFLTSSEVHISVLDYKADNGLQVTAVSGGWLRTWGQRFSIGIGFDDMVSTFHNPLDGSTIPPPISERLFLLHTPCDKRFQFTLKITW
jgi:hypothetical protein